MNKALQSMSRVSATFFLALSALVFSSNQATAQDNVISNGDFSTGDLTGWTTYVQDGVSATIAVEDSIAGITEISGAGQAVWHVQLYQEFTSDQLASLEIDSTYLISFDAKAGEADRSIRMFFGVSDPYVVIREKTFSLSTEMETYTAKVALSSKNEGTKLAFEMGLSNADVFIDNISITKTEPEVFTLPVTFESADLDYILTDFNGNSSSVVADPTDATNTVAKTIRPASNPYAGTTIGPPSGFVSAIPFTASETVMSVRVWSPIAGAPIRLKVEDSDDPTTSVETQLTTTVAESWETLVFDFSNQVSGTSALNLDADYDKASIFFNFEVTDAAYTFYWDDVQFGEGETSTSTEQDGAMIPSEYALNQNYPNPFNPSTTIEFSMPQVSFVTLEVYNMVGQKVATLVEATRQAGVHTVSFDASDLSSGTYLYRLQAGNQMLMQKMTLIK